MQYPSEIPGLNSADFLKAAMNAHRSKPMSLFEFYNSLQKAYQDMGIPFEMSKRNLNEGFSGGEKKRNEIFQMAMLEPKLAILDETDSGLDIDALRIVANGVNTLRNKNNAIIVVTHYQRLLDHIVPDFVHVLYKGKIVKSGPKELALELEAKGYDWIKDEIAVV
jgi:Fe-S cluster assembly ATP-binding protein